MVKLPFYCALIGALKLIEIKLKQLKLVKKATEYAVLISHNNKAQNPGEPANIQIFIKYTGRG